MGFTAVFNAPNALPSRLEEQASGLINAAREVGVHLQHATPMRAESIWDWRESGNFAVRVSWREIPDRQGLMVYGAPADVRELLRLALEAVDAVLAQPAGTHSWSADALRALMAQAPRPAVPASAPETPLVEVAVDAR